MGKRDDARVGPDSLEAGLRAVFGNQAEPESVLEALGMDSVRLRAAPDGAAPAAGNRGKAIDDLRYLDLGEIARGGVGIVFRGRDKDLAREVALKVLRPEYAENDDILGRFVEEAQIGGQLQHPGIVPVYGLGLQSDGRPYFAMKLVKGRTLGEILAARRSPKDDQRRLLGMFEQVCLTVAYAHARGVIHRDLKPANVMVGVFGEVQVVDWGLAKVLEAGERAAEPREADESTVATVRTGGSSAHTVAGSVLGTFAYMPPEQARGRVDDVDERADVFALGGILCEILTGEPPYAGDAEDLISDVMQGKLEDAWQRLDACGAEEELVEFAKRCLASRAGERPRDAGAVADAIQRQLAAAEDRAHEAELAAAREHAKELEEQARLARRRAEAKAQEARVATEKRKAERERARQREERQRAQFERKERTRAIAIAAALLVAVVAGVGALLYAQSEASRRAQQVASQVSSALKHAGALEGSGSYSEALAAAEGALNVAAQADPETREHVRAVVERVRKKKRDADDANQRRSADENLLKEWRTRLFGRSWTTINDEAVALFHKYGIDLADPEAAAARMMASEQRYRVEYASILDQMAIGRRIMMTEEEGGDWLTLVRIAKRVDDDDLRNRLRDAATATDVEALRGIMAEIDPHATPARTQGVLGFAFYYGGQYLEAIDLLRRTVRAHPEEDSSHVALALLLKSTQPPRTQEAARHGAAAMALRPENKLISMTAAFFADDFTEVVRLCDAALAEQPDNPIFHRERGAALMYLGDWRGAVESLRKALELHPRDFLAWQNLAETHLRAGNPLAALAAVRESEPYLPFAPRARAFLLGAHGLFLAITGNPEKGIAKAEEAVQAAPGFARAHYCLGVVLKLAGRPRDAVEELTRAVELDPSAEAHAELAVVLRDEDPDAALSHLRRAVELAPSDPQRPANLAAFLLWQRGEPDRAFRSAYQALRLDGNNARAWMVSAWCSWMKGEMDRFEQLARRIHEANPSTAAAHAALGRVALYRRDFAAATAAARQALAQGDREPAHRALLGECLVRSGAFANGLAELRACLDQEPPPGSDGRYRPAMRGRVEELIDVCLRVVPLAARRGAILAGEIEPRDSVEALAFADLCYFCGRLDRAVQLYRRAKLADRYDRERAAFAAAQGGPEERAYALELLRAELEALGGNRLALWAWRRAPLLAPVRDPLPLARLPDAERSGWLPFWRDVDARLKEAK